MVSISRYFYVAITEPIQSSDDVSDSYEYLRCECDLDSKTINISGKKYDLLSFINAAQKANQALIHREQDRKYRDYMCLESRKV